MDSNKNKRRRQKKLSRPIQERLSLIANRYGPLKRRYERHLLARYKLQQRRQWKYADFGISRKQKRIERERERIVRHAETIIHSSTDASDSVTKKRAYEKADGDNKESADSSNGRQKKSTTVGGL